MRTVRDIIRRAPVWVNPEHTTESAIVLMRGHGFGALPVLEGRQLAGMVFYADLLGEDKNLSVSEVMRRDVPWIEPDLPLRDVAARMSETGVGRLPVIEDGRLLGVITHSDLLPELGRSFDPLTGLPWSDTLREWAIDRLREGSEITLLFFDIDDFGKFNKVYGHVVGDEVLLSTAEALRQCVDNELDSLCRFGGDEFCIATLRLADESSSLAKQIADRISRASVESVGNSPIEITYGMHGGKRTRERERVHYAATINSLINLASRDCMSRKPRSEDELVAATAVQPMVSRLKLVRVHVERVRRRASIEVTLGLVHAAAPGEKRAARRKPVHYTSSRSLESEENEVLGAVAEVTFEAIEELLPRSERIIAKEALATELASGRSIVTVVADWISGDETTALAGSAVIKTDRYRACAAAALAAVNRPLSRLLNGGGAPA